MLPTMPKDVRTWLYSAFRNCNEQSSAQLTNMPTTHEPALDMTLITQLSQQESPVRLSSGWIVSIDTHFLGGASRFYRWEIADIGILVMFRRAGELVRSKVALLQSKRLYPNEQELDEDREPEYRMGFGRLYQSEAWWASVIEERTFSFAEGSQYKALKIGDDQYRHIAEYEEAHSIPVYYLLYNPWSIPWTKRIPSRGNGLPAAGCEVGCRVVPASNLRHSMAARAGRTTPSYSDLKRLLEAPFTSGHSRAGWRLEDFVVDLLLGCRVGYVAEDLLQDEGLERVFYRRTGPIAAALAVTVDAPEGQAGDLE